MEFWGVEVKPGETIKCEPGDDKYLHLSQASLGVCKNKGSENVPLFVNFNDQKLVLGTLSSEKCTQISYDLVFEKEFEVSHGSKNASVHFCGYKTLPPDDFSDDDDDLTDFGSDSEDDVQVGQSVNGKPKVKDGQIKPATGKSKTGKEEKAAAKPEPKLVKPIKPAKPVADDEDDEDDDLDEFDGDEDDSEEESDDEDMLEGDSDEEDENESSEEDEATPKKTESGKKRPAESISKTPIPGKKAKITTPVGEKTGGDGKKGVHIATPHPAKKDKGKQQTPKSTSAATCKSCSKSFNSEIALQAHTKAKHSGTK